MQKGQGNVSYVCEELLASHVWRETIAECIADSCRRIAADPVDEGMYATALRRRFRVFGMDEESGAVCEFIFVIQQFSEMEAYVEDELKVFRISSRPLLMGFLEMSSSAVRRALRKSLAFGMVEVVFDSSLRLAQSRCCPSGNRESRTGKMTHSLLALRHVPLRDERRLLTLRGGSAEDEGHTLRISRAER